MFATRPLQNSTGFCSSSGCWTISLFKGLYFCQTWSCCCGIFGNFPQNCQKRTPKKNIFHHVILEKTPLFSHIFVYYFSLSTFWFSRAKDLSPSPESPETTFRPASEVPKFLPIEQSLAKLCPTNCSSSHGSWVFHVMETHEASLGKFMPYPWGLMDWCLFGEFSGAPLGKKNCKKIYNSKMQNFQMRKPPLKW